MRVLLVQPRSQDARHQRYPPMGLLAVGTYLRAKGHEVQVWDRNVIVEEAGAALRRFGPDIAGLTAFTAPMITDALRVATDMRRRGVPVVWGGVHPSLLTQETLQSGLCDYVVVGEGEETMVELLEALQGGACPDGIAGLAMLRDGDCLINPPRPFLDLSALPPTDWTLVDPPAYFQGFGHCARLIRTYTSKGCTGRCTFCYNQAFHRRTWRGRTPEQIADEALLLSEDYGADGIGFIDELWSPDAERLRRVCELFLERKLQAHWYFNARVDQYTEDDLRLMHRAGCRWILFGVETGSPRMLKEIRKGIDLERVQATFDACRRLGIGTVASFMAGFPGETAEDLRLTARFALGLGAGFYDFTRYMCYPGTELFDRVCREGKFDPPRTLEGWARVSSWDHVALNLGEASRRELSVFLDYFAWLDLKKVMSRGQQGTLAGYLKKFRPRRGEGGLLEALKSLAGSGLEAARIALNVAAHPRLRRRLGLALRARPADNGCKACA